MSCKIMINFQGMWITKTTTTTTKKTAKQKDSQPGVWTASPKIFAGIGK